MKTYYRFFGLGLICVFIGLTQLQAQEYANFEITATNEGTGTFINAALSNFNWSTIGSLTENVEILDSETFDDGSQFELDYGQADSEENLRTRIIPNGSGTAGTTITSGAITTIIFSEPTPANAWGFCLTDIDVENVLIKAKDAEDNPISNEVINNWLVELFDADQGDLTNDTPKWDPDYAAILGSDTPEGYTFDTLVIGGLPSCEAPAAYFRPNIPIKTLEITFMNLQEVYSSSYHLFIASMDASDIVENEMNNFRIFPNPCSDKLVLEYRISNIEYQEANIVNISGSVVKSLALQNIAGLHTMEVDISDLPAGVYFVRIQTNQGIGVKKLIVR